MTPADLFERGFPSAELPTRFRVFRPPYAHSREVRACTCSADDPPLCRCPRVDAETRAAVLDSLIERRPVGDAPVFRVFRPLYARRLEVRACTCGVVDPLLCRCPLATPAERQRVLGDDECRPA